MKIFKLFFSATILFFSAAVALAKVIPYSGSGLYYNSTPMGYIPGTVFYGPWMGPMIGDPCGIMRRDYSYQETLSASTPGSPSALGTVIGSSTPLYTTYIHVKTRIGKITKSTLAGSGCPPYMMEMVEIYPVVYNNAPLTYFGFSVSNAGLTYYGWVKVENGMYFAYIEDIPGFSIKVGDMEGFQTYPSNFTKLTGTVYRDNNIDGVYDTGDTPVPYQRVSLEGTVYITSTNSDGSYTMMVPGSSLSGSKNVSLTLSSRDVYNTPANGKRAVSFPQYSEVANLNFGVNYDLTTASQPQVKVSVQQVTRHRRCFKSSTKIVIENKSNVALTDVPLLLEIPAYVELLNSTPNYQSMESKVASYTIPTLAAYGNYTITLTDSVICGIESIRGQSQCYRASINIPFEGSDVFPYYECQDSLHLFKLVNKGNAAMTDSAEYKVFANNILQRTYKYKTNGLDTFYIGIPNDGRSIRLEAFQELSNTRTNVRYIIAEGCGTVNILAQNIGMADQMGSSDDVYYSSTTCFSITDSYDPNELLVSPTGWGTEHKIVKEQLITYHIGFQNTGSADAISIVLVDTLSSALDLPTFKVKYSTHAYRSTEIVPLADGRLRLAVTYAGINLPPSSVNEPVSHGYIEFSILPKSTTAIGTKIKNTAYIYFDYNSYIQTNSVLQTISLPETVSDPLAIKTSGGEFDVENQTLMYGDAPTDPALVTNAGASGLEASSLNTDIVTFESGKLVIHKSGTATLNYKHNGNERYLPITGTRQRTVTVSKAPLQVSALSTERFIGTANPVLEWNATGFVYEEDETVLQGNPEITCMADVASALGEYPITVTVGTLLAENYELVFTPGILKVVQVTSIDDWSASGIRVYPIPAKGGTFTVEVPFEKLHHVTLTDMLGKSEAHEQGQINSQLKGLVMIKIYTDKGVYSGRVELMH